jgi:hypothetical protein
MDANARVRILSNDRAGAEQSLKELGSIALRHYEDDLIFEVAA